MSTSTTAPTSTAIPSPDLIEAARAAVEIDARHTTIEGADHNGDTYAIPISITPTTGGGYRIEVMKDVINEVERQASGPIRRAGNVELGAVADFIAYVNRFKTPDAIAFAPANPPGVTAIFDYHPGGGGDTGLSLASWCGDRASYRPQFSRQWLTWTNQESKPLGQVPFGDFIEANQFDLRTAEDFASATVMIRVARDLVINVGSKYQRTINPTTGEGTLVVKDEHDAATSTKIPSSFALAIPVFEGDAEVYPVDALLRFTMAGGTPQFTFILQNKAQVLEHALAGLRTRVAEGCGIPVFVGNPPAATR